MKAGEITVSINGGEPLPCDLQVERQMIDVSTATARKPDPSWTFVDSAGHFHAFDHEGQLPTISRREEYIQVEREPDCLLDDLDPDEYVDFGYSVLHVECGICGEEIKPHYVPDDPNRVIPGRVAYTLTIRGDVPPDRFSVLVDTPTKVFFGFGQSFTAHWDGPGRPTHEVVCGPMSWRPKPKPPEKPDVWAGLRQRTEEGRNG